MTVIRHPGRPSTACYPQCQDPCTFTKPTVLGNKRRNRHPRSWTVTISHDEFKEHVWNRIARYGETYDQAHRKVHHHFRPVRKGKRVSDGLELERFKIRITPLEAQRRMLHLYEQRYLGWLGGARRKKLPHLRRPLSLAEAKQLVLAKYCVMGTWEDIQAYGDSLSAHWRPWGFHQLETIEGEHLP